MDLSDTSGVVVAGYLYDSWGDLTSSNETFTNGWSNPYRYDGRDGARSDAATGLYWLSVRAYDPTLGRFLSRDPLNRAPLFLTDNPYVYAGANPLSNVDPSGQYRVAGVGAQAHESWKATKKHFARIVRQSGCDKACEAQLHQKWLIERARGIARNAAAYFNAQAGTGAFSFLKLFHVDTQPLTGTAIVNFIPQWIDTNILSSPLVLLGNGLKAFTGGAFVYDLVSLLIASAFQREASDSAAWWLDPLSLTFDGRGMEATIAGFAAAVAAVMILLTVFVPDFAPIWVVAGIFWMARINSLFPTVHDYIDQEKQVFGYA
ncbi:MAG TPA: RHS repeat-associated core domain-containing protein [Ktedonobacterales bacterium]